MLTAQHAAAVAARFALGADPVMEGPVARGEVGQVWKLTTDRGSWAVKETFGEAPDVDETEAGAALQEAMERAGVPVPHIVRADDGAVLATVGDGPAATVARVYAWVELCGPDRSLDPLVVGAVLAGMHSVHVEVSIEDWPVHEWYVRPIGESRWTELVAAAREHGAPFADPLRACAHAMIAAEDVLRAPRDVQLCHRDVFADNVLPTASGGICVIDWENSGPAEPAQELALALYDFAGRDAGRVTAMYRSYVQHGGPARLVDASDFTMVIASLHHITERHISRWLDPALQSARAHSAAGVFEFLAEPPTLDLVDSMLEAIRA